jgi:hypothetical protein
MLLLALQEQNRDILLVLREVQIGVQTIQTHGGGGGAGGTGVARLVTDGAPGSGATGGPMLRATPTGKLKELQDRLQSGSATVAQAVTSLKSTTEPAKSSNTGFYMMILGYIVISYLFNN